jgi:hypothetical protein
LSEPSTLPTSSSTVAATASSSSSHSSLSSSTRHASAAVVPEHEQEVPDEGEDLVAQQLVTDIRQSGRALVLSVEWKRLHALWEGLAEQFQQVYLCACIYVRIYK